MPQNMSFIHTTEQIINRTKTVTRRLGWRNLRPGQRVWAVKKSMGLRPGEKIERLALLEITSNRLEALVPGDDRPFKKYEMVRPDPLSGTMTITSFDELDLLEPRTRQLVSQMLARPWLRNRRMRDNGRCNRKGCR